MFKITIIVIIIISLLPSCTQSVSFRYNLLSPDKRYELPAVLKEISGVAAVNDSIIACVGDELGIVYFYNLAAGQISGQLNFTAKGDFEDLTIIGDTMYVLNSHGTIWVVKNYRHPNPQIMSYPLNIEKPFELEGLYHRGNTLYTAAKYYHNKKRDSKGDLPVWPLSLPSMIVQLPVFSFPDFVHDSSGTEQPFHTSAILYDEKQKEWLAISTHTKVFLRCNEKGQIIERQILTAQEFSQPEGLCFTPSGNLLISNEGREGPPTILLFTPKKP
jgi:hypothetical protein